VLPEDFNITLIDENPELTDNGEYSLDVTVSLLEPKNAIAFKNINRINLTSIPTSGNAYQIVNGNIKFGSIIILSNTDIDVTFQFLSGNSELNYIANYDNRKIWSLDWGSESSLDYNKAYDSIIDTTEYTQNGTFIHTKKYGDGVNYVCAPVKVGDSIVNNYTMSLGGRGYGRNEINGVENVCMQPYLLYYINKLPSLLGYVLDHNILNDDERCKRMYVLNTVQSLNYADALPDMSISEFITAIEDFFFVRFTVKSSNKTISIDNLKSNYSQKKTISDIVAFDNYERKNDSDSKTDARLSFTKISYDLSEGGLFKYQKINDDVINKCVISHEGQIGDLLMNNFSSEQLNGYKLYQDSDNEQWMYSSSTSKNIFYFQLINNDNKIFLVNKFRSFKLSEGNRELVFKIVPAEICQESKHIWWDQNQFVYYYQLPNSSLPSIQNKLSQNLLESIQDGVKTISRTSNIEMSMYLGMPTMFNQNDLTGIELWGMGFHLDNIIYPFSYVDIYPEFGFIGSYEIPLPQGGNRHVYDEYLTWCSEFRNKGLNLSLRLDGDNGILESYRHVNITDGSKIYTFYFEDKYDFNVKNLYIINNKKYVPISFERIISSNSRMSVKGTFYTML
jgi:hypothetical protein